jgi:hypothetical protein
MPLGILQDRHLEHVPGTATLADLNPVAALQGRAYSKELKKSSNGTILVPQPSDDPNGMPRNASYSQNKQPPTTILTQHHSRPPQLPSLATRPDNGNPLPQQRHRFHPLAAAGRKHPSPRALLQHSYRTRRPETAASLVHQCSPVDRISSFGRWGRRLRLRRFSTRLGKKASVLAWDGDYHYQLGMGGRVRA